MFCIHCGEKINADSAFCIGCGKPASDSAAIPERASVGSGPAAKALLFGIGGVIFLSLLTWGAVNVLSTGGWKSALSVPLGWFMPESYPEAFGIYLVDGEKSGDGKFRRLLDSKDIRTITAAAGSGFSVLIHDKRIAGNTDLVKVYSGVYIRNFRPNDSMRGNLPIRRLNSWGLYKGKGASAEIAGQFYPVKGHPDKLLWKPSVQPQPGVYYIEILGGLATPGREIEPFFLQREAIKDLENSRHCVDYYQYYMEPSNRYFPCTQNFTEKN